MTFNKNILSIAAIGILGLAATAPTVSAATSNANIEFTNPTTAPSVLNPENPDQEITPDQEGEGNTSSEVGVLTLDFVSNFYFAEQSVNPNSDTYYAQNTTPPFAQVTDIRGTGEGWRLTAQMSPFINISGESTDTSLEGAEIVLTNAEVGTSTNNSSLAPSPEDPITLASDGTEVDVTTANENQGRGSWLTIWEDQDDTEQGNQSVALNVPGGSASQGEHRSEITWTLYDAPTGGQPTNNDIEGEAL